jgi:hypothetical protein
MSNPKPSYKFPKKWKTQGDTVTIRIPLALKDKVIAIAKELDARSQSSQDSN